MESMAHRQHACQALVFDQSQSDAFDRGHAAAICWVDCIKHSQKANLRLGAFGFTPRGQPCNASKRITVKATVTTRRWLKTLMPKSKKSHRVSSCLLFEKGFRRQRVDLSSVANDGPLAMAC